MGDAIDMSPERYNFTWNGKKKAIKLAQQPSSATLKPRKEKAKDWDNTKNLYIEGDNLEVLKLLQKSYSNKIKMIYIDPPYNTGKDFVYKDKFSDSIKNYLEQTGQIDSDGNKLSVNVETNGRYHTDWLNMMYPRLKLARNLLKDTGAIFISIDDNEVARLRLLLDEIFGENNFVQEIAWRRTDNQANVGSAARVKEYILVYAKDKQKLVYGRLPLSTSALKEYRYEDDQGGKFRRGILLHKTRGKYFYPVETKGGIKLNGPWMVPEDEFWEMDKNNEIYWTSGGEEQPYSKIYLSKSQGVIPNDFWGIEFGTNQRASLEVEDLFEKRVFDFPKPISLLKNIIKLGGDKDSIVLDFFSGSSSTAQAVMELNGEDGGDRKFIMVQLPEKIPMDSNAREAGYNTIPEVALERIRLAGERIIKENPPLEDKLDIGFKVFELSSSNIKKWSSNTIDLSEQIEVQLENIKDETDDFDLVYEILLKEGFDISLPIEIINIKNSKIYKIASGALFIILGCDLKVDIAIQISLIIKEEGLKNVTVVFKDTEFVNDSEKLNTIEVLRDSGIQYEDILSI